MDENKKPVNPPKFVPPPPAGVKKPVSAGVPKPFPGKPPVPPTAPVAPVQAEPTAPTSAAPVAPTQTEQSEPKKKKSKVLPICIIAAAVVCIGIALTLIFTLGGSKEYSGPYSTLNGMYGGVDDLGRELYYEADTEDTARSDREVGIFYFFAQGLHGDASAARDNNLIVQGNPDAPTSELEWTRSGGASEGQHFWGKPIFDYYTARDPWVKRKEIEMLVETGIDYIVFDCTNAFTYDVLAEQMLGILKEYQDKGWNVPKVAYYTHSETEQTVKNIYTAIYKKHPEYDSLWYRVDGKPLMIGHSEDPEIQEYFHFNAAQWPNDAKIDNGFPWMEFDRYLTDDSVYQLTSDKTIMSVSPAQHNQTSCFSATAWYGYNDRSRSYGWEEAGLSSKEEGMLCGINYTTNFNYVLEKNADNMFITGFNEWVAGKMKSDSEAMPIKFVDCADPDCSRDIEPMDGILKDNYLMQTANFVKQFKGSAPRVDVGENRTIDITGDFSQFDGVTACYSDFTGDTEDRGYQGFGKMLWNKTGRNDIANMKVCMDEENIYFYVDTVDEMKGQDKDGWMNLFIRSQGKDTPKATSWEGFDFVINRTSPTGTELTVEKSTGGWNWTPVGTASFKQEGNKMMLKVSKSLLGIDNSDPIDIQFKWSDNTALEGNVMDFYTDGDAAPYGRYTYIFSKKA